MSAADLFPETLPAAYRDVDEARALTLGLLSDWFGALSYTHSESSHTEILESLAWPGMPEYVREASLHIQEAPIDFDEFSAGVLAQARAARRAGLVVEDGKPRPRTCPRMRAASGDLFGDDGNGGAE